MTGMVSATLTARAQSLSCALLSSSQTGLTLRGAIFLFRVKVMDKDKSNAGDLAVELLSVAEDLVMSGEDPDAIRAAFYAVLMHMQQQRDEADQDARDLILRGTGLG